MNKIVKILITISITIPVISYIYFVFFYFFKPFLPNWLGEIGVRCFFISLYIIPFHLLTAIYFITIKKDKLCAVLFTCTVCTLLILSKVAGDI